MSKKKIKKNTQKNLKIFKFSPENIIGGTKKNIENFFQNLKKDREKNKLRIEKEKKLVLHILRIRFFLKIMLIS